MQHESRSQEHGFTLIELLIAITISGLIMTGLATGFIATIRGTKGVHDRFVQTHDAQLLATSFTSDVQSADPQTIDTAAGTATGCSGASPGTNLVRLQWTEAEGATLTSFSASYRLVPTSDGAKLVRYFCSGPGALTSLTGITPTSHVVAYDLAAAQPQGVFTSPKVELTLTSLANGTAAPAYTYTLSGTTRVPAPVLPFTVTLAVAGTKTAGTPFDLSITARKADGSTDTSYSGSKTVTFSGAPASPNGTSNTYPASVLFNNGVGTATGVKLVKAQTTNLAVSQGFRSGTVSVAVAAGTPSLGFSVCPPDSRVSRVTSETVTRTTDAYGNTVTSPAGAITVTLTATNGGTMPASTTIASGSTQSLAFNYTNPATSGAAITMTAHTTAPGYADATCSFTTINPVFLISNPGNQTAGTAFNVTITASSDGTNPDPNYDGAQTLSFNGPGAAPNGTPATFPATVTFVDGVGTASVTLVRAESATLAVADSTHSGTAAVTVLPAGMNISFSVCPPDDKKNRTTSERILRQDAYGNASSTATIVTLSATDNGATFSGFSVASITVPANSTQSGTFNYTNPNAKDRAIVIRGQAAGFSDTPCSFTTTN